MDLKLEQELRGILIEGHEAVVGAFRAIDQLLLSIPSETLLEKQVRTVIDYTSERYTRAFKKMIGGRVNVPNR